MKKEAKKIQQTQTPPIVASAKPLKPAKRSPKERVAKMAAALAKQATRLSRRLDGVGGIADALDVNGILVRIQQAQEVIDQLPADWKPKNGGGSALASLKPGDIVGMKPHRKAHYAGVLSEADLDRLKVVQIVGKRGVFEANGIRLFLPLAAIAASSA
jgi:hypothetical protein